MNNLLKLSAGDTVDIIAPASRATDKKLSDLKGLLQGWQLNCRVDDNIFGEDILCANTDSSRFNSLKDALLNPESKAVICVRGGYGSARLLSELNKISAPAHTKLFVGMSDITALHLFLLQKWGWPVIHGALAPDLFSEESTVATKNMMLGNTNQVEFAGLPMNEAATKNTVIESTVTGGNLCILQTSLGTPWQLDAKNKILFIEEVNERGYRVDRMLEHLRQAGIFNHVSAVVLGDFTKGDEPDGTSLIDPVLKRFASECPFPVVKISGVGHDKINFPLPFGTAAKLKLGSTINLTCAV